MSTTEFARRSKLVVVRGLPASGKSTWAKAQVVASLADKNKLSTDRTHIVRINRDDLRAMLHDGVYVPGVTEEVVIAVRDAAIRAALKKGCVAISDDTNLRLAGARQLYKLACEVGAEFEANDSFLEVDVEECVRRDVGRGDGKSVGSEVIRDTHNRFLRGKEGLPFPELPADAHRFELLPRGTVPAIIVDIDGTTAHNDGHRGFYEYDRVKFDEPKKDVIAVVQAMVRLGYVPLFVSGRSDACREVTAEWIWEHVLSALHMTTKLMPTTIAQLSMTNENQVGRYKLFMRHEGDYRDDALIKYEIAQEFIAPHYDVKACLDDRLRVCRMWHAIGWPVLRVGDPDADF